MKPAIPFCLIALVLCFSCAKSVGTVPFDYFVFSYSAETINYSVKFTDSDTAYFQLRYPNEEERYALLKKSEKDSMLALIQQVRFNDSDTIYFNDNVQDGIAVKFYQKKGDRISSVYNYEVEDPNQLLSLGDKFDKFTTKLKWYPSKKRPDYGDLSHIELPPPPPVEIQEAPKTGQNDLHIK